MDFVYVLLAIVLLGVLIFVHELGHFIVAKLCGVKVLKFSLGFGPALVGFQRGDTYYCVSAVPLGGFVKMAGEDPTEVIPTADRDRTLNAKPLWQRFLIMAAGPGVNLLFPILLYLAFYLFSPAFAALPAATIGYVTPGTPAMKAGLLPGDRIVSIDGEPVKYFEEVRDFIRPAEGHEVILEIERAGMPHTIMVPIVPEITRGMDAFGIRREAGRIGVAQNYLAAQMGVDAASPAARAGLETFDVILELNGEKVSRWLDVERKLASNRGEAVSLKVKRGERVGLDFAEVHYRSPDVLTTVRPILSPKGDGTFYTGIRDSSTYVHLVAPDSPAARAGLTRGDRIVGVSGDGLSTPWDLFHTNFPDGKPMRVTFAPASGATTRTVEIAPEEREYQEKITFWFVGVSRLLHESPDLDSVPVDDRFSYAVGHAFEQTGMVISGTVQVLVELFRGQRPFTHVGGPITIFRVAKKSAERGWASYLWLMAIISINLGLFNLLPIPLLDGGHLLFYTVEAVRRRPVSLRFREIASFVGLSVLILLIVFVFKNDIEKAW